MLQRIQTVFLLLAAIVNAATLFTPLWKFTGGSSDATINGMNILMDDGTANSFMENVPHIAFFALVIIAAGYLLFVIFQYNDRLKQVKLAYGGIVIILLEILSLVLLSRTAGNALGLGMDAGTVQFGFAFPVLAVVLIWLAVNRIRADEKLVRSVDRFR